MRVIIPTDFSENAYKAVDFVYKNFNPGEVKVALIHTVKAPASARGVLIRIDDIMRSDAELDMKKQVEYIKNTYGASVDSDIKFGYLKDWITKQVKANNIDLLVMGTKGENNAASKLLGSTTESIIRTAAIPLVAVPNIPDVDVNNVLFATDNFNFNQGDFLIDFLSSLKGQNNALNGITILPQSSIETIPKSVPLAGYHIAIKQVNANSPVEGINEYIDNNKVDLLVLFHSRNSRLDYLFNRSVTKTICSNTQVPILVIPRH